MRFSEVTATANRERRTTAQVVADLLDHGTTCVVCRREATPEQVEEYVEHVRTDPEPLPWYCDEHEECW